jgi:hypothetical protein
MMRLTRAQFASWKLLITLLIAVDLFALSVWATRPPSIYSEWLGQVGFAGDSPVARLVAWGHWENGPRTPSGLITLFDLGELFFAGVFLLALILLFLLLLAPQQTQGPLWRRLRAPLSMVQALAVRFRVRTALAAIAVLGLYLGWEIHAWRTWQLRNKYLKHAALAASAEERNLSRLQAKREQVAKLEQIYNYEPVDVFAPGSGFYRSKAALSAERLANKHQDEREIGVLEATAVALTDRRRKYEQAAADPWKSVAPDQPLPDPILQAYGSPSRTDKAFRIGTPMLKAFWTRRFAAEWRERRAASARGELDESG